MKLPKPKAQNSYGESKTSRAIRTQSQLDKAGIRQGAALNDNHFPQGTRSTSGGENVMKNVSKSQGPKGKGKVVKKPNPRKSPKRPSTPTR
jgi:hypothetical protein